MNKSNIFFIAKGLVTEWPRPTGSSERMEGRIKVMCGQKLISLDEEIKFVKIQQHQGSNIFEHYADITFTWSTINLQIFFGYTRIENLIFIVQDGENFYFFGSIEQNVSTQATTPLLRIQPDDGPHLYLSFLSPYPLLQYTLDIENETETWLKDKKK